MKFLAMLRDSFREATDGKVFPVMLVLTGLLVLFVGSFSLRPVTVAEQVAAPYRILAWAVGLNPNNAKVTVSVENEKQEPPGVPPWDASHSLELVFRADDPAKLKATLSQMNVSEYFVRAEAKQELAEFKTVLVTKLDAKEGEERYRITAADAKDRDPLAWENEPSLLFAVPVPILRMSPREAVYAVESTLFGTVGTWVLVLIGVVITAAFVPNMMQKGAVDLMLVKPIGRVRLLLYKFVGGLTFVFLLTGVALTGVWVVVGLASGIWAPGVLAMIPAVTFSFAVLYSVSTLAGVWSRSPVVAIVVTVVCWFGLWLNGTLHTAIEAVKKAEGEATAVVTGKKKGSGEDAPESPGSPFRVPASVAKVSDVLYTVLPRTGDLDRLTKRLIAEGVLTPAQRERQGLDKLEGPRWAETLGVSGAFIALMLGLACWRFASRDY